MGVDLKVHDLRVDWTHLKGTQQLLLWNESASYIDPIDDHRTQKGPKTVPWIPELCETTNWGTNPIPIEIYMCIYIYMKSTQNEALVLDLLILESMRIVDTGGWGYQTVWIPSTWDVPNGDVTNMISDTLEAICMVRNIGNSRKKPGW